jgi:hypothetical protein
MCWRTIVGAGALDQDARADAEVAENLTPMGVTLTMVENPVTFEELKAHAPADWSFSSLEEQDEDEPAD